MTGIHYIELGDNDKIRVMPIDNGNLEMTIDDEEPFGSAVMIKAKPHHLLAIARAITAVVPDEITKAA